jgi:hypothetical protein
MSTPNHGAPLLLLACIITAAVAYADPSTETPGAPNHDPTVETLKKAHEAGYTAERDKAGLVKFCKSDANIGTHFKSKKCYDENRLALVLRQEELQREQFMNRSCFGGGACGGSK